MRSANRVYYKCKISILLLSCLLILVCSYSSFVQSLQTQPAFAVDKLNHSGIKFCVLLVACVKSSVSVRSK